MVNPKEASAAQDKKQKDELLSLSFNEWLFSKSREETTKISLPSGKYLGAINKNWCQENGFETKSH